MSVRLGAFPRQGGKIVISHPKGAGNVEKQRRANPVLVPNRLPTEQVRVPDAGG